MVASTAKVAASAGQPQRQLRRALSSTFLWLFCLLIAVDFALLSIRPLRYVQSVKYIPLDQNSVVSKVPEFFASQRRPDALLLGSSLPMQSVALWDAASGAGPDPKNLQDVRLYTRARYLEEQLAGKCGKQMSIFNLTCVGCMASDAYLLLKRAVDAGRAPRIVFWGIAPRDFVDNTVPPVGKTPVYEVLADWRCLNDFLKRNATSDEFRDFVISSVWYYYRVKSDYRTLLATLASDLTGHQVSLYAATEGKKAAPQVYAFRAAERDRGVICTVERSGRRLQMDLAEYQGRYNPPNFARFEKEREFMLDMIALCRENGIKLVVFNMPLTAENRALIAPDLMARYRKDVLAAAREGAFSFVDIDAKSDFAADDFTDSAHTSASGGRKVQDHLVAALAGCSRL